MIDHFPGWSPAARLTFAALFGFLFGSLPFGYLIARRKGIDIFSVGSGNPGATNVWRVLGWKQGLLVFVLDVGKGTGAVYLARSLMPAGALGAPAEVIWFGAGILAVLGHCFSPWIRFRGGKGIATLLGAALGAAPAVAFGGLGIFLVVWAVTRYVSLASIVSVAAAAVLAWFIPGEARELVPVYVAILVFVVYRHRGNIRRLMSGDEPKFPPRTSRK